MSLPNEALLDVLLFADLRTIVTAKFVGAKFLGVVTANEHRLAIQRRFQIVILDSYITYTDLTDGARRKLIRYELAGNRSFAAACRALVDVIGQHVVAKMAFFDDASTAPAVDVLLRHVPAVKSAENVSLYLQSGSQTSGNLGTIMRNFTRLKSLSLQLDYTAFHQFSWSFLLLDAARDLRTIAVRLTNQSLDDQMEYNVVQSIRRMISVVEESRHEVTITMWNCSIGLLLDLDSDPTSSSSSIEITLDVVKERVVIRSLPVGSTL